MQIRTDRSRREVKSHGSYEFPVLVSQERLSAFEKYTFQWHWHKEMEWTYIKSGEIRYQVNEREYHLKEGDGLFCNSNMMHTGGPVNGEDCHYVSFTVHPRLLESYDNSFLQKRYVKPLTEDTVMPSFSLSRQVLWQREILDKLEEIEGLYNGNREDWDFRIYLLWMEIWLLVCNHRKSSAHTVSEGKNIVRLKRMISYLQTHYREKITLEQLAAEINICPGECCRFFKKHMQQSIFDYLLDYRIQQSLPLLSGDCSVTEAGEQCGFSSAAYFTKVFRQRMGCSPKEYRKRTAQRQILCEKQEKSRKTEENT